MHKDWGVHFSGNLTDVRYTVAYGDSGLNLDIEWDNVGTTSKVTLAQIKQSTDIVGLLTSVRDAVSIWYNITKDVECYDITKAAPNQKKPNPTTMQSRQLMWNKKDPATICKDAMKEMGSWPPLW